MAPPRSNDAPPERTGVPIDNEPQPYWVTEYLSDRQLANEVGLQWATAMELAPGYSPAEKVVASTIWRKTIGKKIKKAWPTVRQLLQLTGIGSPNTIVNALKRLCTDGWLLREVRAANSRRLAPARPGQAGVGYRLAWPLHDCIGAPLDGGPERCGAETTKGGWCTTRAGKGTTHRGTGPCWRHGGIRASTEQAEDTAADQAPPPSPEAQPKASAGGPGDAPDRAVPGSPTTPDGPPADTDQDDTGRPALQLVKHSRPAPPVDNKSIQLPLLQPVHTGMLQPLRSNASTVEAGMLQPLRRNASTVVTEGAKKELVQGAKEETRGSDVLGAEVEGGQRRSADGTFESDSAAAETTRPEPAAPHLTIDQAHLVLKELAAPMRGYYLSRAAFDLRRAGRPEPTPDELVIAAAAAARRQSA